MRTTIFTLGLALAFAGTAAADVTKEMNWSFDIGPEGRVSLENINGDVNVTGGTGSTVEVLAKMKAGTQKYLDKMEIKIREDSDAVFIEVEHPDSSWFSWGEDRSGSVSFDLTVPAGTVLDAIETVNGSIVIAGVAGDVSAETVNGDVEVEGPTGDVTLETVNGSLEASFERFGAGQRAEAGSVNGRITLYLPADASFSVDAETVNGGIDADDFGLEADKGFVGRDLRGEVGDGGGRISLETVNGAIKLRRR